MSEDYATRTSGLQQLEVAATKALARGDRKLAVAARLALAEADLDRDRAKAHTEWAEASRLLETIGNASLSKWKERLWEKLDAPFSIRIDRDMNLREARDTFVEQYLHYRFRRFDDYGKFAKAMRVSRASIYRYMKKKRR
jgi:hypothetical protein